MAQDFFPAAVPSKSISPCRAPSSSRSSSRLAICRARAVALQHSLERPAPPSPFTSALPAAGLNKEIIRVLNWRDQVSRLPEREGRYPHQQRTRNTQWRPRYSEPHPRINAATSSCTISSACAALGCSQRVRLTALVASRVLRGGQRPGGGAAPAGAARAFADAAPTVERSPSTSSRLARPLTSQRFSCRPSSHSQRHGGDHSHALNLPVHADAGARPAGYLLTRARLRPAGWLWSYAVATTGARVARAVVVERLHGRWHRWCGRWRGRKRRRARRQPYDDARCGPLPPRSGHTATLPCGRRSQRVRTCTCTCTCACGARPHASPGHHVSRPSNRTVP